MSGMGPTLQALPSGGPGGPVPGHQRDHSLRLVRVSWVL